MGEVVEIRHQVAVAGRVTEAHTGRGLGGTQVLITSAPSAFVDALVMAAKLVTVVEPALDETRTTLDHPGATDAQRLQAAQTILDVVYARGFLTSTRPDRTQVSADGLFVFIDLPDGDYTFTASLAGGRTRYGQGQAMATIARSNGDIQLATADMAIPSTTLRGQITGPSLDGDGGAPVAVLMAAVQVRGSGELTYSDSQGHYLLAGLEAGARTVSVAARGYQTHEQTVTWTQAGEDQVLNVSLALPP